MSTYKVVPQVDDASSDSHGGRSAERSWLGTVLRKVVVHMAIVLLSVTPPFAFLISIDIELPFGPQQSRHHETGPGERRAVSLDDGTLFQLNENSRSSVKFDDAVRRVRVTRGEASFSVSRDPRPFHAYTPHAVLRATPDAIFSVLITSEGTEIHVRDAPVEVELVQTWRPKPPFVFGLGKRVTVERGKVIVRQNGEIILGAGAAPVLGSADGHLRLRGIRLADAVAEINGLHERQLRVEDADLADEMINGLLNPYDRSAVIDYALQRGARLERLPDGTERLTRGSAKARVR